MVIGGLGCVPESLPLRGTFAGGRGWCRHPASDAQAAIWVNRLDCTAGRQVWHNFRETRLTYQRSYLSRLNYVHRNPVRHRLVPVANLYPWCSAAWFERTASPAQVSTVYAFPTDRLNVYDDYDVPPMECDDAAERSD